VRSAAAAGVVSLSGLKFVAAIEDNAETDSLNATTAKITISFSWSTPVKRRNAAARKFVMSRSRTLHDGELRRDCRFVNDY
jgi:hypothetical protein